MTLMDKRIEKDLTELYNDGATPGDIQNALLLDGLDDKTSFATRALPLYYVGDRKAQTVMVMLNPGCDAEKANQRLICDIEFNLMKNAKDIRNYHKGRLNYGHKDSKRPDNFDLKQAFFLHKWDNTGITLPDGLCPIPKVCSLKKISKEYKQTLSKAKEIVLTQKLQLELIPYASRAITKFNPQKIDLLIPFVETLFDEIFSHERKYVIFCSKLFVDVFKAYKKKYPESINIDRYVPFGKIGDSNTIGTCNVITIHYKRKSLKAIIANTFPSRALPNAYHLMEIYGELCYKEYIKK